MKNGATFSGTNTILVKRFLHSKGQFPRTAPLAPLSSSGRARMIASSP